MSDRFRRMRGVAIAVCAAALSFAMAAAGWTVSAQGAAAGARSGRARSAGSGSRSGRGGPRLRARDAVGQAPQTPQAQAPIDLTGWWVSVVTEDWRWRMVTPPKGDYASLPINNEGRRVADTWDPAKDEKEGNACKVVRSGRDHARARPRAHHLAG